MATRQAVNGHYNRVAAARSGEAARLNLGGLDEPVDDLSGEGRIVLLTPMRARDMLEDAGRPRTSAAAVKRMADEMLVPSFRPRPVKYRVQVSEDGVAVAGHDVLAAVSKAGVPVKVRFVAAPAPPAAAGEDVEDVEAAPDVEDAGPIRVAYETITPELAAEYLSHNVNNRRLRDATVSEYAAKMQAGAWVVNHQGIAFAADGRLQDGQHRLWAIVKSGVAVKMLVARGYPAAATTSMDVGKVRNANDMAEALTGNRYGTEFIAAARMMITGARPASGNHGKIDDMHGFVRYIMKHEDAIRFALGNLTHDEVRAAVFRAVVARAYYHADRDRLETFCRVISTGRVESLQDTAATTFMRMFVKDRRSFFSASGRAVLYRKLEATLRAFLRGQPLTKIQAADGEVFPLDDDGGA